MPPTPPPPPPPQVAHTGEAAKREIKRTARERAIDVFMARDCIKKDVLSIEFLKVAGSRSGRTIMRSGLRTRYSLNLKDRAKSVPYFQPQIISQAIVCLACELTWHAGTEQDN